MYWLSLIGDLVDQWRGKPASNQLIITQTLNSWHMTASSVTATTVACTRQTKCHLRLSTGVYPHYILSEFTRLYLSCEPETQSSEVTY